MAAVKALRDQMQAAALLAQVAMARNQALQAHRYITRAVERALTRLALPVPKAKAAHLLAQIEVAVARLALVAAPQDRRAW